MAGRFSRRNGGKGEKRFVDVVCKNKIRIQSK